MRALSGDTSDKSPYLTDFSAVTVAIAPKIDDIMSIQCISPDKVGIHKTIATGKRIANDNNLVPSAREYSSIEEELFVSMKIFPASSQRDFKSATMSDSIIQIIFNDLLKYILNRSLILYLYPRYFSHL